MAKWVCFGPLFFNRIRWIQLCDKKNLKFVDCCDNFFIKLVPKNVRGSQNNIYFFKTGLVKIYLNS